MSPRQIRSRFAASVLLLLGGVSAACTHEPPAPQETRILLRDGWQIQAASEVKLSPEQLSQASGDPEGWYPTQVPRTVLAALVDNGVYHDLYVGRNLEQVPSDRFQQAWWYRTEFQLPADTSSRHAQLTFEGINYRANIWLNGQQLAKADEALGAFRIFDYDITAWARPGSNVLAIEVFPPRPGDFTIGFVDWNPRPPDANMGLWRPVSIRLTGPVAIDHPVIVSDVDTDTLAAADLTVSTEVSNRTEQAVSAAVTVRMEGIQIEKHVDLEPHQQATVTFEPGEFPQLKIKNPRLWWPNNLGDPNLYTATLNVVVAGANSDARTVSFGIREVGDYINEQGHRGYTVNGRRVLIRGGGWVDDLLLADDDAKIEAQMRYVRHMNLNTVRLEGFWGSSEKLYHLADRYGLLVMVGWSCQWEWENYLGKPVDDFGGIQTPAEMKLITASLRDQVLWLRNHPSIFVWVFGSDMLPRPELERGYLDTLGQIDPTRPSLSACSIRKSEVTGPSAVKMNGPYDYVTPNYWYEDTRNGGAFGFNTETGPGPQPPPIDSIRRMIPAEHLWPIDDMWDYHCGRNEFNTMKRYLNALNHRYGESTSAEDFAQWAQVANYEAIRAMFEAFGVNQPNATGVVQWMLNSAWPETYWQLYDWYLMPNGAFYGTRTAAQPLNFVYNYGTGAIHAVNDTRNPQAGLKASIQVFDSDSKRLYSHEVTVDVPANSSQVVMDLPAIEGLTTAYFLDLQWSDASGTALGRNFYWLSTRKDVLDEAGTLWFVTPNKAFADFRSLRRLPKATLEVTPSFTESNGTTRAVVELTNPGERLAFFVELQVTAGPGGEPVRPIFWDDNYVSLLPGQKRVIEATFATAKLAGAEPIVAVSSPNLE